MFALGSALENRGPPEEWGQLPFVDIPQGDCTNAGAGRKAQQLEGPAGTVILYDARTWHRTHINRSTRTRSALLFVFTPRWILPMGDQAEFYEAMRANASASGVATEREVLELERQLGDKNAAQARWPVVTAARNQARM